MKHESIQIDNLLSRSPKINLTQLGLHFTPTFRKGFHLELMEYVFRHMPLANLGLPIGTVFQVKELNDVKSFKLLCIAGTAATGNILILINQKLKDYEASVYRNVPDYLDVIRYLEFPDTTDRVRGMIGQLYGLYKKQVKELINRGECWKLKDVSFFTYLHEYVITEDIPSQLKEDVL